MQRLLAAELTAAAGGQALASVGAAATTLSRGATRAAGAAAGATRAPAAPPVWPAPPPPVPAFPPLPPSEPPPAEPPVACPPVPAPPPPVACPPVPVPPPPVACPPAPAPPPPVACPPVPVPPPPVACPPAPAPSPPVACPPVPAALPPVPLPPVPPLPVEPPPPSPAVEVTEPHATNIPADEHTPRTPKRRTSREGRRIKGSLQRVPMREQSRAAGADVGVIFRRQRALAREPFSSVQKTLVGGPNVTSPQTPLFRFSSALGAGSVGLRHEPGSDGHHRQRRRGRQRWRHRQRRSNRRRDRQRRLGDGRRRDRRERGTTSGGATGGSGGGAPQARVVWGPAARPARRRVEILARRSTRPSPRSRRSRRPARRSRRASQSWLARLPASRASTPPRIQTALNGCASGQAVRSRPVGPERLHHRPAQRSRRASRSGSTAASRCSARAIPASTVRRPRSSR